MVGKVLMAMMAMAMANSTVIEDEDVEAAKALVSREGTDVNKVNSAGSTPLYSARK